MQFGGLGLTTLDGKAGETFATVDKTGETTTSTARSTGGTAAPVAKKPKRKPLVKTLKIRKKGKQRVTLRQAFGTTDLAPGWYRVLIHGVRADGIDVAVRRGEVLGAPAQLEAPSLGPAPGCWLDRRTFPRVPSRTP